MLRSFVFFAVVAAVAGIDRWNFTHWTNAECNGTHNYTSLLGEGSCRLKSFCGGPTCLYLDYKTNCKWGEWNVMFSEDGACDGPYTHVYPVSERRCVPYAGGSVRIEALEPAGYEGCPKNCDALGAPTNGIVDMTDGENVGSVATFGCTAGFELTGLLSQTCNVLSKNSGWTDAYPEGYANPSCVAVDANAVPCDDAMVGCTASGYGFKEWRFCESETCTPSDTQCCIFPPCGELPRALDLTYEDSWACNGTLSGLACSAENSNAAGVSCLTPSMALSGDIMCADGQWIMPVCKPANAITECNRAVATSSDSMDVRCCEDTGPMCTRPAPDGVKEDPFKAPLFAVCFSNIVNEVECLEAARLLNLTYGPSFSEPSLPSGCTYNVDDDVVKWNTDPAGPRGQDGFQYLCSRSTYCLERMNRTAANATCSALGMRFCSFTEHSELCCETGCDANAMAYLSTRSCVDPPTIPTASNVPSSCANKAHGARCNVTCLAGYVGNTPYCSDGAWSEACIPAAIPDGTSTGVSSSTGASSSTDASSTAGSSTAGTAGTAGTTTSSTGGPTGTGGTAGAGSTTGAASAGTASGSWSVHGAFVWLAFLPLALM